MAEVSKLPGDGESVGVNQIRNKVNEIIDRGVGGGSGASIDVGIAGDYGNNLANQIEVSPSPGSISNEGLRNTSTTYIPNGGTERIADFPIHQNRITDETGINMFAILVNGKLYTSTGNLQHGSDAVFVGSGTNSSVRPGLENMREFHMGGYYNNKPDVQVLDFYLGLSFSAVLMSDGVLWGWGPNNHGQLAQGNTTTYYHPVVIDTNVIRMWAPKGTQQYMTSYNRHASLYWKTSKDYYYQIRCAGYNGNGVLGDGTTTNTGTSSKPYVITQWNHLHQYTDYRLKNVYNFSGAGGFVFIVLQHNQDARVQNVIACGYNDKSNLGIDLYDSHTSFGPSKNSQNSGFPVIMPSATVNVKKWLWCLDSQGNPSWTPTWRCFLDSCLIEIMGFFGGFHHGSGTGNFNPWAMCWSRVWTGYGNTQGDFLRAAGSNEYSQLGALEKGFGTTSAKSTNYKTFKYIAPKTGGYTWDEALADVVNNGIASAKLAAPSSRSDWNRMSVNIAENFSLPGSQDLHHGWLALTDEEGEGFWKNYHTNIQVDKSMIPWSRPQADDSGSSKYFQGYAEYVYYALGQNLRKEAFTESTYQGSGEADGIRADNYFTNSTHRVGRGMHDMISIGRGETTSKNYVFVADTHCTNTTIPTFKTRIWRSESTTSRGSYADVSIESNFSVSNIHTFCNSQNGYKLHYVNPYIGKFVHLDDIGDLVYISWHHDNNQLVCARTADLGSNWTYNYSTIEGAWGQRSADANINVAAPGVHTDGGVTSAVYLGQGVIVAAFGGANPYSARGLMETNPNQALLVRSFDYGKNWHMIGDADMQYTFSNLNPKAYTTSHFHVGRYHDVLSNKYRLICFAGSGGTTGQGYYQTHAFGWTIPTGAYALAYSDDFGDNWNWCTTNGDVEVNYNFLDSQAWPDNNFFRGDSIHFCEQQSKVYAVNTSFKQAEEWNAYGQTRPNWGERAQAWTFISSDGGKSFVDTMSSDHGIIQQNGVYNKGGGDLHRTGVSGEEALLAKSYRNIMKLEPFGTDGVLVFWQRNSDQEYQGPGYGTGLDNSSIPVVNYRDIVTTYGSAAQQPEHRITAIYDIMTPEVVRNGPNVADYFLNPYHYSWASNNTYKRLFNEGSFVLGAQLANGDINFVQGGYGNLNTGSTIVAYAKKFDQTLIGFTQGEHFAHTMAGSFVGYDEWRDLSNKSSNNQFIFQAGGALYPLLNDIGGPSTTRSWGAYIGNTRYFGYWIEKEVNIDGAHGTKYLARDSADGKPCVDVSIPEINRFTSPTVSASYTDLFDDPVTQIRDIRTHASGAGGVIVTLSNGKVWSTGYNGLSQRGNGYYTNGLVLTTNLDYPVMIPYPSKTTSVAGWDKCMLAIAPYGTHDHYTSILMRDQDNQLWGWGYNAHGELGAANDTQQSFPVKSLLPASVFPSVMGQMSTTSNGPSSIIISTEGDMYAAGYNGHNSIAEGEGCPAEYNIFIPIRNPLP